MSQRIQFARTGGSDVLELADVTPAEPGQGEVRITNKAVGLNFIDIYVRTGLYPAPSMPSGLGTEGAGVVDAVGAGVTHLNVGDRVAYAQGPLGAYACQWAKSLGVKLIGTVSSQEKADLAMANGAWATINYSEESVVERVRELTNGEMCDVVYDSVGKDTWEMSLDCLKTRGLMVSFGNASGPVEGVNIGILNQKGSLFVTRPSLNGYADTRERLEMMSNDFFSMLESGKIKIDIANRYPLAEAGKAQDAVQSRKTTGSTILLP